MQVTVQPISTDSRPCDGLRTDSRGPGTRCDAWLAVLLALILAAWSVVAVEADSPGTTAIAFVPGDGNSQGIELHSQTVDAVIGQSEGVAWADTAVWVKLLNPASKPVTLTIQVPGPQLARVPLPQDLEIQLNEAPFDMPLVDPEDAEVGQQRAVQIVIPPGKTISLRATYSQTLPVTDGLATFAYLLTAADQWANTPESLRVTIEFDPGISPDQMLAEASQAHNREYQLLTWDWERERALENVGVAFMTSQWWDQFESVRAATTAPDANVTAYLALGRQYRHLAMLPRPEFTARDSFWKRSYPAMVAAFQAAARSPGTGREDEIAAHTALAEIYLEHATRLPATESEPHLQLTAEAAEAALALGAEDANLRALAETAYDRLAQIAQAEGDPARQSAYLDRRAAHGDATDEAQRQMSALLSEAARAAQRGEIAAARQMVTAQLGADAFAVPGAAAPRARQAVVTVTTGMGQRIVRLALIDAGPEGVVGDMLAQASIALTAVPGVVVSRAGNTLTVTLEFEDSAELVRTQAQAATALPDDPELALLAAALTPRHVAWHVHEDMLKQSTDYIEHIDLGSIGLFWAEQATRLMQAMMALPANVEERDEAALSTVRRAVWTADAATWRVLAGDSFSTYQTELGPDQTGQSWQIAIGEGRVLSSETTHWLTARALGISLTGLILLVSLAAAIWRWG